LLAQQNSNRGRAHRFGQGHVRRGAHAKAGGKKIREVVRMQAAARGFITRRQLKQAAAEAAAAEAAAQARNSAAAVVIQASYRRYWARQLSRWLRVAKSYERQSHTCAAPPTNTQASPHRQPRPQMRGNRKQRRPRPTVGLPN
jgi:hypothetical protein